MIADHMANMKALDSLAGSSICKSMDKLTSTTCETFEAAAVSVFTLFKESVMVTDTDNELLVRCSTNCATEP